MEIIVLQEFYGTGWDPRFFKLILTALSTGVATMNKLHKLLRSMSKYFYQFS